MKLWNLFGFGVIALALATGCNKHPENLNGPEIEDDGEPLYVSMNLQLPMASPGTRTQQEKPIPNPGKLMRIPCGTCCWCWHQRMMNISRTVRPEKS